MNSYWQAIKSGDEKSFIAFYDEVYTSLFHYGVKINRDRTLVKECLHMMFCELWEKRERLSDNVRDPKLYLFIWLKRIILREVSAKGSGVGIVDTEEFELSVEDIKIESEQVMETTRRLERALAKLTKKQRRLIELRFYEGKSYEEIALQEKSSVRTIYNVIYEAIKSLRKDMLILFLMFLK